MDEEEAKRRLVESSQKLGLGENPVVRRLPSGDWLATWPELPERGVVLRTNGLVIPFFGALGKLVPRLGLPISPERLLGSARQGRYQSYDRGLGIWEALDGIGDIGFPIATWESPDGRARSCNALTAFFDLRGFTKWSGARQNDPAAIQGVIETLEDAFQDSFSAEQWNKLFAKSTGDGFMVISEALWFDAGSPDISPKHVWAFCQACARTIQAARRKLPDELAIGCGITSGPVTQLFLLGRVDYIGPQINDASKIQNVAYNELCVAEDVVQLLRSAGSKIHGWDLPGKGLRVSTETFSDEA